MPPLIIVDAAGDRLEPMRGRLASDGWTLVHGWTIPHQTWNAAHARVICTGQVKTEDDAASALIAAARGAGVLVAIEDGALLERFYEDLSRLGDVEIARPSGIDRRVAQLTSEEARLLELLGEGRTLGQAAAELYVSRRTADRRLASARARLGVRTTAEAVVLVRRSTAAGQRP
jgi:DNA-binding CsgD family transcriptional regulator